MSENKKTEKKKSTRKKSSAKKYVGLVMIDFKLRNDSYKRGDTFITTDKAIFDKLIRIFKINNI